MNRDIARLRESIDKLTHLLTGKDLKVTHIGTRAYVETNPTGKPVRINIPNIPDSASDELIMAVQGFVDHEVAHVLFTDWAAVLKAAKHGNRLQQIHNIVEDTFIERAIAKEFKGSGYNLDKLHYFFIKEITEPALAKAKSMEEQFGVLLVPVCRAWAGQQAFADWLKAQGHWEHPLIKELTAKLSPTVITQFKSITNSWQALEVAEALLSAMMSAPPEDATSKKSKSSDDQSAETSPGAGASEPTPEADDEDAKPGTSDVDDIDASGDNGEDDAGDDTGGDDSPEATASEEPEDDTSEESPTDPKDGASEAASQPKSGDTDDEGGDDGERGDGAGSEEAIASTGTSSENNGEGDGESDDTTAATTREVSSAFSDALSNLPDDVFDDSLSEVIQAQSRDAIAAAPYSVYTTDFDRIEPLKVSPHRSFDVAEMENRVSHMVGPMQKEIERMMAARSHVQRVPGHRSGRLHSAGLHRLVTGDDRVFRRMHQATSKDTAVCLLIDNSGSMHGQALTVATAAGYALSCTLERVRIAHEVLGFTTDELSRPFTASWNAEGRHGGLRYSRSLPIYMPIYKGFDERVMASDIKRRFACAYENEVLTRENIDGESVEYAAKRLLQRPEKRKVLIVLSDGQPAGCDDCYAGQRHLKSTIADLGRSGVECIGIGILSRAVSEYYPRHIVLEDLDALPTTVIGELRRVLS